MVNFFKKFKTKNDCRSKKKKKKRNLQNHYHEEKQ